MVASGRGLPATLLVAEFRESSRFPVFGSAATNLARGGMFVCSRVSICASDCHLLEEYEFNEYPRRHDHKAGEDDKLHLHSQLLAVFRHETPSCTLWSITTVPSVGKGRGKLAAITNISFNLANSI